MSRMAQSFARSSWWVLLALGATLFAGCRDEPPSPAGASARASASTKRLNPELDATKGRGQRVSPEAQKRFRVEVCAFGTLGLLDVRDAYLKSLGGAEPGPKKIPSFGIAEATPSAPSDAKAPPKGGESPKPPAKPAPSAAPTAGGSASAGPVTAPKAPPWLVSTTLQFSQVLHACTIAKKLAQPPAPELDGEMERYDQAVTELGKLVAEARDYYLNKSYEADAFKRGKELHAQLVKAFAGLDARVSALGTAVEGWHKQLPKPPDALDPNGELSEKAVDEARALAVLLSSKPEPTSDALKQAIERVKTATDALEGAGAKDTAAPHPLLVVPALHELLDKAAVAQQQLDSKALTARAIHEVAGRYAGTVDASQRALARVLGVRGLKGRPRPEGGPRRTPDLRPVRPMPVPPGSAAP